MKFLVLLCAYKRPNMVRLALRGCAAQTYQNFTLAFVDDSGPNDRRCLDSLLDELPSSEFEIRYMPVNDEQETKLSQGGSRFGEFWNQACYELDADVAVMNCDDDTLHPDYLQNLKNWFEQNPQYNYCHSHVIPFNPFTQNPFSTEPTPFWLNHSQPVQPSCVVDASQVAWRVDKMRESNIRFPSPATRNLDAAVYGAMHAAWGPCMPTNFYGQYKGLFHDQLSHRGAHNEYEPIDLPSIPDAQCR